MAAASEVKRYAEREHTRFDHQWEIKKDRGYLEFDDAEDEFTHWAAARSRATGDGPLVNASIKGGLHMSAVAWIGRGADAYIL
jgi:Domain of unknown function (DUF4158)